MEKTKNKKDKIIHDWIDLDDDVIINERYHKYNFSDESCNLKFPENIKIYIVGDLHGDFHALEEILTKLTNLVEINNIKEITDKEITDKEIIDKEIIGKNKKEQEKKKEKKLYRWKGGNSWFICLGDLIDRKRDTSSILEDDPKFGKDSRTVGEDDYSERKIIDLLNMLSIQAKKDNGRVIKILGNHDLEQIRINSNSIYLDYVSPKAYLETIEDMLKDGIININKANEYRQNFKDNRETQSILRNYHFNPNGLYCQKLLGCETYLVLKIDNWIFSHGGILSKFVENFKKMKISNLDNNNNPDGLEYLKFINNEMRKYMSRKNYCHKMAKDLFFQIDSPIYNRQMGSPCSSDEDFEKLKNEINKMEEKEIFGKLNSPLRIVVAHCPQVLVEECQFTTWIPTDICKKTKLKCKSTRFNKISIKNDKKQYEPKFVGINGIKFNEDDLPQIWRLDVGHSRAFDTKWLLDVVKHTCSKGNNQNGWNREGLKNYFRARRIQVLELKKESKNMSASVIISNKGLPRHWLSDKLLDKN